MEIGQILAWTHTRHTYKHTGKIITQKGKKYLERSNKIPMAVLGYKTPLEKRQELIISLLNNYNTFISLVNA